MHARFTLMNIQGLVTKYTNKLHSQELQTVFNNSAFVMLTETWAGEFSDLSVPGFNLFQLNRVEKKKKYKTKFWRYRTLH